SSLNLLSETLEKEKIKNVFTANGLGQYQLMFYTKGEVNARYLLEKDRLQKRVNAVNEAYNEKQKTALLLLKPEDRIHFHENEIIHVTERLSLVPNPGLYKLRLFNFETGNLK
ncbi:MAG: hypothetical protein N4A46_15425, partial [Schleiferiaceae bacterium]|nr:hypothetical protein [Schleiferiaceae bacterium]